MINAADRRQAVELVKEAVNEGAALYKACAELGISKRTYNRWKNSDSDYIDKRTICVHPEPVNKLTKEEKKEILDVCNSEEFASKTPCEIVPILADRGIYLASESTFYKVLREANQVWMWDITYLNGPIKGQHYYLYMFSYLYSRKIVGWEIWESEDVKRVSELVKRIYQDEKINLRSLK